MSDPVTFIEVVQCYVSKAHGNSKNKGFWDKTPNIGEKLLLMVSEICEAFEAHRKGIADAPCDKDAFVVSNDGTNMRRLTNMEEELADLVIRVMDYCGYANIDLGRCILSKMLYNTQRPHMHGKTC